MSRELDRVEVVECQPPDRQKARRREKQPVQEPESPDVFAIWVPAVVRKDSRSNWRRYGVQLSWSIGVRLGGDDLGRLAPETNRLDHVLADAEAQRGIVGEKDPWIRCRVL